MARFHNNLRFDPRRIVVVRPRRRRRRPRFRWEWLLIPGVCILAVWFLSNAHAAFSWEDVMDVLHVHNREQYTMLAVMGLVLVAIVAIARVLRRKDDES